MPKNAYTSGWSGSAAVKWQSPTVLMKNPQIPWPWCAGEIQLDAAHEVLRR